MRYLVVTIFLFLFIGRSFTQEVVRETPYQPGEYLKYLISYGWINGGYANIITKDSILNSKTYHHITISGYTTGLADKLYKVHDAYESFVDPETDQTHLAIRNISEGRYKRYNEVRYHHDSMPDSTILYSQSSGRLIVEKHMKDIVGAVFYARKYEFNDDSLQQGKILTINTWFTDELFPLRIRYIKKEKIETDLGEIECYKFSPVTEVGRLFKTEDDMRIWISADKNKLPIRVQFNIFIGSVYCDLIKFNGLKYKDTFR